MAQLVFHCPYTNQPIPSGIEAGADCLKTALDYPISLRCPHCGLLHHGTVADGYLTDEGEPLAPSRAGN
jgi:hypothetical protein